MKDNDIIIKITHKSAFGKISYETSLEHNDEYYEEECDEMFTLCVRVLKGAGYPDLQIKQAMENWLKTESEDNTTLFIDFIEKKTNK